MTENANRGRFISGFALKLIAATAMLLDHMAYTVLPGHLWLNCVGRLAFPIYAFLIAEGFRHTSSVRRYILRLLAFAALSEIPFNLVCSGTLWYAPHQNVMFTFAIALGTLWALERCQRLESSAMRVPLTMLALAAGFAAAELARTDYGCMGVLTVAVFYYMRQSRLAQLAAIMVINSFLLAGQTLSVQVFSLTVQFPVQGFAVAALAPIWLYSGKQGLSGKAVKYGFYAFYPAHLLVLALLAMLG